MFGQGHVHLLSAIQVTAGVHDNNNANNGNYRLHIMNNNIIKGSVTSLLLNQFKIDQYAEHCPPEQSTHTEGQRLDIIKIKDVFVTSYFLSIN